MRSPPILTTLGFKSIPPKSSSETLYGLNEVFELDESNDLPISSNS